MDSPEIILVLFQILMLIQCFYEMQQPQLFVPPIIDFIEIILALFRVPLLIQSYDEI